MISTDPREHAFLSSTSKTKTPSPVTPSSPCSKYSKSPLTGILGATCPFKGVVLSMWDNILGPRVQHMWRIDNQEPLKSDLLAHITSQVLSCEITRDPLKCEIDYKFYNLPHKGVIVPSFVFSGRSKHGLSVHAMFVVIPSQELKFYLEVHDVFTNCFNRLIGKFRVILEKNIFEVAEELFSPLLAECVQVLSLLHSSSLVTHTSLLPTAFSPDHVLEKDFMSRCIASHLMTFGRTLVIGETAERINLLLYTLSLFNSPSERRCSLPVCVKDPRSYHHDLFLQGVIKSKSKSFLPLTEISASHYPTTIVDLTSRDVKQTRPLDEHVHERHGTLKNELICLQYGHLEPLVVLDQELFASTAFPDTFVKNFIKEIFELPELLGVREAYIHQFMRLLNKRALCLIEYVKAERYGLRFSNSSNEGQQLLRPNIIQKMRHDLQLNAEGDYRIVLAMAEKLKPGLYCFLRNNRKVTRNMGRTVETL